MSSSPRSASLPVLVLAIVLLAPSSLCAQARAGASTRATPTSIPAGGAYLRQPSLRDRTLVFVAEGDIWRVDVAGGEARRLTTGEGEESSPEISPDGRLLAFSATYDGAADVYVMPMAGGVPRRLTWEGGTRGLPAPVGWTRDGRVMVASATTSTLPGARLETIDPESGDVAPIPLAEAASGAYTESGDLIFTRYPFQGSHAKRYEGGTAQSLWVLPKGDSEATPLTSDYAGTSKDPILWNGHVYFLTDRDGTMNVWAGVPQNGEATREGREGDGGVVREARAAGRPDTNGVDPGAGGPADAGARGSASGDIGSVTAMADLTPVTHEDGWDIREATVSNGLLVYRVGASLKSVELGAAGAAPREIPITLPSDFRQEQERWITEPMKWVTNVALSPSGDRVALTARGQVFVAPTGRDGGRLVEVTRGADVRYRNATWAPDGRSLVALSDESGEVEVWRLPASGVGDRKQLTKDGTILRWRAIPSPDGARIAHTDKNARLWVTEVASGKTTLVATDTLAGDAPSDVSWSPNGRWLAYVQSTPNSLEQIWLWDARSGSKVPITTDRLASYSPAWSPDGKWLWFLSDRNFQSIVGAPWGAYWPEPYFDKATLVYALALTEDASLPMGERTELDPDSAAGNASAARNADAASRRQGPGARVRDADSGPVDLARMIGLRSSARRLYQAPIEPGNYRALSTDGQRLYVLDRDAGSREARLEAVELKKGKVEPSRVADGVRFYDLSKDGKKLLIEKGETLYVIDAGTKAPDKLDEKKVDLSEWRFSFDPREEWRQMYADAWRLHRDYFWDPGMRGMDWTAIRQKYAPLVDRVTDREELADVLGMMISELSTMHAFIRAGDVRKSAVDVAPASLGAEFERDTVAGGWRIVHVYRADPDLPDELAPLARPEVRVGDGDVILAVDGRPTLGVTEPGALLVGKADRQVLLRVRPAGGGPARDVVVKPISMREAADLRYDEWEYTRRLMVDSLSGGRIGYVHLRAMSTGDAAQFTRDFQAALGKDALIFDDRHNRGGNIDSWVLDRLSRRAWMWWKGRMGVPYPNMQQAFIGPMLTLVDAWTASDGEAFAEGFRRLGLGKLIGTRTWGGEIWLTSSNVLVDNGIATAAEFGVYGPEGKWLIEGHGVDPDIVVDNDPAQTFAGRDAQLGAAVAELLRQLKEKPTVRPKPPAWPRVKSGG